MDSRASGGFAVPDSNRQPKRTESAKAAAAFRRYVALGDGRSLRKLADADVQRGLYKNATAALRTYAEWSVKHHWQQRLEEAATAEAERMLEEAARLDAETFLATSRLLNERAKWTDAGHLDAVVKMRESVRKPQPKGGTSVNVRVSVEVRQLAERYAEQLGVDPEELIRDAEAIAAGAWGDN